MEAIDIQFSGKILTVKSKWLVTKDGETTQQSNSSDFCLL